MIIHRFGHALAVMALLASAANAETVRFETNAGNFDLVLNPTSNSSLQPSADNFLNYVTSGRYDSTVINRAETGFVLHMGFFKVSGPQVPATINGFTSIAPFAPIAGVPAGSVGLTNTNGTVGYGLVGGVNGYNHDSATSSFYINLGNNSFLDPDFTVFAIVPNMATVNSIVALPTVDLTQNFAFGATPGDLRFTHVPQLPNGDMVVISRAFVVPEPTTWALIGFILPTCLAFRGRRRR